MKSKWIRVIIFLALLFTLTPRPQQAAAEDPSSPTYAEGYNGPPLIWPFATGHNWKVTQGYNTTYHGGDGQGALGNAGDKFTFDLVRADGTSSVGQTVYAAQDGKIGPLNWMLQVYDDNGNPTNYYIYHGHLTSSRSVGTMVQQGDSIGTIDNLAHLHFGVARWSGSGAASANFPNDSNWIPVYFRDICGQNYPFSGGTNEYLLTVIEPCDTISTSPTKASNIHPSSSAGWYGHYTNDRTPSFAWTAATDPDGDLAGYYVAVDDWTPEGGGTWDWWAGNVTAYTIPRTLPEGQHTFAVTSKDEAGNTNPANTNRRGDAPYYTFYVDSTPPTMPQMNPGGAGCVGMQNNLWQNTCRDPAFTWHSSDSGSGVADYAYAWGTSSSANPSNWSDTTNYDPGPIAAADGSARYYLHVRARDELGNPSSPSAYGIWYDGSIPIVTLSINNDASTTNQTNVHLNLSAGDTGSGVADVRISHNGLTWTDWQSYEDVIPWTLPALDRRDLPVYVQVRDHAGNESVIASDTITLDLYPPMPHSANYRICQDVINVGGSIGVTSTSYSLISAIGQPWGTGANANASTGFTERAGFLSSLSGCLPITRTSTSNYTVTQSVIASGGNLRGSASFRLGDTTGQPAASGTNAFSSTNYVLSSGFWAAITGTVPTTSTPPTPPPVTITPTLTPTPSPTPTPQPGSFGVTIDDGALFTNDPLVTVRLWGPNVTHMRISNDGGFTDTYWRSYQITTTWPLSTYGSYVMPRLVYAQFKDAQGAIYGTFMDDIIYDPVAPEGQVNILGISRATTVTLLLESWDDNSGVDEMRVADTLGGIDAASWQPYTETLTWGLQGSQVYAQFRDHAGNPSSIYDSNGIEHPLDARYIYLPLVVRND